MSTRATSRSDRPRKPVTNRVNIDALKVAVGVVRDEVIELEHVAGNLGRESSKLPQLRRALTFLQRYIEWYEGGAQ